MFAVVGHCHGLTFVLHCDPQVDAAVTGPLFEASASPSLSGFIRDTCRDVSKPAYEAWGRANNRTIGRLGSGYRYSLQTSNFISVDCSLWQV